MPRYFLKLAYDGTHYHGWQIQENTPKTVQQLVETALNTLLGEKAQTTGCGRTDTGVHAREFFAHFDSEMIDLHANPRAFLFKLNSFLPDDIAVEKIIPVKQESHARFDAVSRTYEYRITRKKNPFLINKAYFLYGELDIERMNSAAAMLPSYEEFGSFSKSNTQVKTQECKVEYARWEERDDVLVFTIKANRFLRNMVRAITGTMIDIGRKRRAPDELHSIILSSDRSEAGASVPACGLYLRKVEYPPFYIPERLTWE